MGRLDSNKQFKIAIIGAGVCGLYISWKLSQRGHDITIFEKKEKIGKECCSGLFSERILNFIPQARNLIEAEYNSCLIHFPKKTVKINLKKRVFFIEHSKLNDLVYKFAKNAGVEILLNQQLEELPKEYDKIIGCDGPLSFVRRKLNLPNPKFYLGIQKFVSRETFSQKVSRETLETWPIKDGFLWKIPRKSTIEYGIMAPKETLRDPTGQAPPLKAEYFFKEFLEKEGVKPDNLKSALIPQGLILPKHKKITLCGDAAGLTKPWSGGGVIWGLTTANILIKHFPDFLAYRKAVRKFFLPQIIFSKTAKNLVYFLGSNFPWLLPKKIKIDNDFLGR